MPLTRLPVKSRQNFNNQVTSALRDHMRIPTAQGVCGDFHGRRLEAQTQAIHEENYRIGINKDFMPVFGERSLHDVKKKDIKEFIYALQGGGAFPAHDTDIRQFSQRI